MTTICTHCNGTGHAPYLAFNIVSRKTTPVTETAWFMLPKTEDEAEYKRENYCRMEVEECRYCNGEGEVEYDSLKDKWDAAEHRWEERRERG